MSTFSNELEGTNGDIFDAFDFLNTGISHSQPPVDEDNSKAAMVSKVLISINMLSICITWIYLFWVFLLGRTGP